MLGVAFTARTTLVETAIQYVFRQQAGENIELHITNFNNHQLRIEGVRVGPELSIGTLNISYDFVDLIQGQIGSVLIEDVDLDLTDPHSKIFTMIEQQIAGDTSSLENDAKTTALPHVMIQNVSVRAKHLETSLVAELSGEIQPDNTARLNVLSGHILTPHIAPISLTGQASFDGTHVTANVSAQPNGQSDPASVSGVFNTISQELNFKFAPLSFEDKGRQPSDFVPQLKTLGPVNGTVSGRGMVAMSSAGPTADIELMFHAVGLSVGESSIRNAGGKLKLKYMPKPPLQIRVETGQASLNVSGQPADLKNILLEASVNLKSLDVNANLLNLSLQHPQLAPLNFKGIAKTQDDQIDFSIQVKGQPISARVHYNIKNKAGTATVNAGPWNFEKDGVQPESLSPLLSVIEDAKGGFGVDVDTHWEQGTFDGAIITTFDDLTMKVGGLAIEGLKGTVKIDRLKPPTIGKVQKIVAQNIGGEYGMQNSQLNFTFVEDKLTIKRFEADVAGGMVTMDEHIIDPYSLEQRFALDFSQLDLSRLFDVLNIKGVSGDGRLNGSVPLRLAKDMMTVKDGKFSALGPGTLKIQSSGIKNALSSGGENANLLLNVLENFQYKSLILAINSDKFGKAIAGLSLAGSNPNVMDSRQFILNINLETQIDKILKILSAAIRLSQKSLQDTIRLLNN